MIFHVVLAAFTVLTSPAFALTCIAGDANDRTLVNVFNDASNPDNRPINTWRSERSNRGIPAAKTECQDCRRDYFATLEDLLRRIGKGWSTDTSINPDCVEASMADSRTGVMGVTAAHRISYTRVRTGGRPAQSVKRPAPSPNCRESRGQYHCPIEAKTCDREQGTPTRKIKNAPCVTREMAEYVAWILDKAITCLSPEEDQIDRRTIVRKLNNESQFMFMVDSRNGTGLAQLVPIATKEMLAPERGYGSVLKPVVDLLKEKNPKHPRKKQACSVFADVLARTPPRSIRTGAPLRTCELLQPGNGVARSALLGIGTFAHVSYTYTVAGRNISADAMVRKAGFNATSDTNARGLRDLIALSYYSAAGPRGGLAVYDETSRALGCPSGKNCTSEKFLNSFKTNMSAYYRANRLPNYFNEMDQRKAEMLKTMDGPAVPGESRTYSQSDIQGDRCIE